MKAKLLSFGLVFSLMISLPLLAEKPVSTGKIAYIIKQEKEIKDFNGIATEGPLEVTVTLGNTESISFEGDEEAISELKTEVKNNTLTIRPKINWTIWTKKYQNKKVKVFISAKSIKRLVMSGSGGITVNGRIKEPDLSVVVSGSGRIRTEADINSLNAVISGSGTVSVSGTARDASIVMSGSGVFNKGLAVDKLSSVISGSGNIDIKAEKHIDAVISGSGSIRYSGNPTVQQRVSGSGRISKV